MSLADNRAMEGAAPLPAVTGTAAEQVGGEGQGHATRCATRAARPAEGGPRRCVFLDRDGVIVEDSGHIDSPSRLVLLPGAAEGIRQLNEAGLLVVLTTNQSVVARGMVTEEGLAAIHQRLREMLAERGACLDAVYYCPYHPDGTVARYCRTSEDRKPNPGMLLRAAREHRIDLRRSFMVGDRASDILAGRGAGCMTLWVAQEGDQAPEGTDRVVASLHEAVEVILGLVGRGRRPGRSEAI